MIAAKQIILVVIPYQIKLFRVERDSSSPEIISFDGYFFYIDGQEYKVDDYKFVKDFKEFLTNEGFIISGYLEEDVEFLKTKNILNFDTNNNTFYLM